MRGRAESTGAGLCFLRKIHSVPKVLRGYCKFGNVRVTFISLIFAFQIISKFKLLN